MQVNNHTQEALTRLPREELRRLLAEELNKEPTDADDALVRSLLAELQTRGADPAFVEDEAVVAACEKFRTATQSKQIPKKRWCQSWMLKVASVLLALVLIFFTLPQVAEAGKAGNILSWWSNSLFQLFRPGDKPNAEEYVYNTDHPGLQQIYDTVVGLGITEPIVPQQLSAEFQLTESEALQLGGDTTIYARFTSNRNEIIFVASVQSQQTLLQHEKRAESIAVWDLNGIDHYVISNTDTWVITWVADNIECTVTTDCPEEDVYRLIKSIYTLED